LTEALLASQFAHNQFLSSEIWDKILFSRLNLSEDKKRRLSSSESNECAVPTSSEVIVGRNSVQISDLSAFSVVCLGAIINEASVSSYVLRVYIASKPVLLNADASLVASNGHMNTDEYSKAG